jgi:small subunit ribosomal protein S8e
MAVWQGGPRRSRTGRRIRYARNKRKYEIGRETTLPTIGAVKQKPVRTRANHRKTRLLMANQAYVTNPKTHTTSKTDIITVVENPANIHYVRRNILTKGAIVNTKLGKARITSRPGQSGVINAVLIPS